MNPARTQDNSPSNDRELKPNHLITSSNMLVDLFMTEKAFMPFIGQDHPVYHGYDPMALFQHIMNRV